MSTPRKARQSPADAPVDRHFRRRVVLELTADELPLLEAAQARHGTKRGALIAGLSAEARIEELERALADAERAARARAKGSERDKQATAKAEARLERDLAAARKVIAKHQADLEAAQARAAQAVDDGEEQRLSLEEQLEAREVEIAELERYAVDELYCGRCDRWVAQSGWAWRSTEEGGRYAFHESCGDHGPSIVSASSWLAHCSD
jgi:hypothetical protein